MKNKLMKEQDMPSWLFLLLRYLLILLPFTYVLISEPAVSSVSSQQLYWLLILLYLSLLEIRRIMPRLTIIGFIGELVIAMWCMQHISVLHSFFIAASLLAIERTVSPLTLRMMLAAAFVAMNAVLLSDDMAWILVFNLMLTLVCSFQLYRVHMERKQMQQQSAYDLLRGHNYELEKAKQDMIQFSRMVEIMAQMEERSRIAHDLHDELGHQLIRLKMMMDASVEVIEARPDQSKMLFLQVRDQLSQSMELMRATVQRLKPRHFDVKSYSLKRLVEEHQKDPISIDYSISGRPTELYPSMEITFYRNAKEAIANAIRHGQASIITLHLHFGAKHVTLDVGNNGAVPEMIEPGMGLQGMKDRAEALGGRLEVLTAEGITIRTIIPLMGPT
ncbi:sensor histidine kinase [Paenibacillus sp. 1001270B_150601_E10]|uniref:sensor histidine kinase n=1 Tax=Paenibacillus sp. 1001270B_150601_E10 TaxID=2787079 RepID=UPI0018A0EFDB|nr:sensor histidine kinase [Paenibacillus sp. 1001270B_150601_E10]